jgi:type 1 glutamine amidotransferase
MSRIHRTTWLLLALVAVTPTSRGDDRQASGRDASRVYGEWRIRIRTDQGPAYNRLIEQSGLPLFRKAGGRMVGWWTTLIGDLYEQVTIWEYDDMAAFERAIRLLSNDPAFGKFVAARDPLLAGEESRFLRLAPGAQRPSLPEPAPFVVHEVHRVPLARRGAYLAFMMGQGFDLLKAHGFRPAGPWVVDVGRWSEVTYLFRFERLAEREQLIAKFSATADARTYSDKVSEFAEEVTTRLLVPAPFAKVASTPEAPAKPESSALLPHRDQLASGVYAAGFSDRHHDANCGWVALGKETLLIDLPRGIPVPEYLTLVTASTRKSVRRLVLTHAQEGDLPILRSLDEQGISILTSPGTRARLLATPGVLEPSILHALPERREIGDGAVSVDFLPLDEAAGGAGGAVHLPGKAVLFAGPLVINGPRAPLKGRDTELWMAALRRLEALAPARVVPGFGTWGSAEVLARQHRFLAEVRQQVGFHIAQGRPLAGLFNQVRIPAADLVWMPYDTPTADDIESVYRELTVPNAPFHGRLPRTTDRRPHALVLIGDQPHEPDHLEEGLRPVFDATGVVPHFTVDVNALSETNLAMVQLLVILRDGLQRPERDPRKNTIWMTPEQQRAVAAYVENGGAFLNLHNSMGLYPPDGPYLKLVGGRYIGHGPLERFRVEVVDPDHPVTRGVQAFFVADEQHTPPFDEGRVHLLLRNRSDDGKTAAAGWVREPGRGRLCHLANGHTREALLHPMYQRLLRNAVRWCLRLEDSSTSPHTGVSNADRPR